MSAPIPQATAALPLLPAPLPAAATSPLAGAGSIPLPGARPLHAPPAGDLYTVVVHKVPVDEVLFALARDTELDLNIIGEVSGEITLNAVRQPLESILEKIVSQASLRYSLTSGALLVEADVPYINTYKVDYLNISRSTKTSVNLTTQIGSFRSDSQGNTSNATNNGSRMSVENTSDNRFWDALMESIQGIVNTEGADIFVNREAGLVTIRARHREHQLVEDLINQTVASARRQVLIEATVVEVTLNDSFESGVDWRILDNNGGEALEYAQLLTGATRAADAATSPNGLLTFTKPGGSAGDVTATLKLLQQFGDVQVLSSPKIMALNNQTAVLKVVDNRVYFTFRVNQQERENGDTTTQVDSTLHSVPVGLVMNVTAYISAQDEVILNVRPTISRILNFAEDPAPALAGQAQIKNLIPEIQVREMESLLRVNSGEVAIIGGLMQNRVDKRQTGLPGFAGIPLFGRLFSHDTNTLEKTELLVFLRPTVINQPQLQQHADQLRRYLPLRRGQMLMPAPVGAVMQ